jgi:hypothetical protein
MSQDTYPRRSADSLRPDLQELVRQVGLDQGKFKFVVHEGLLQAVEIKPAIRLDVGKIKGNRSAPDPVLLRVDEAAPFVLLRLDPIVSGLIGKFGSMNVSVKGGRVISWHFKRRHQ